jgi:type VI protein secretion system component VasK
MPARVLQVCVPLAGHAVAFDDAAAGATQRHQHTQRTRRTTLFLRVLTRLRARQFLDGIAVVNFVPTPLVMFVTW